MSTAQTPPTTHLRVPQELMKRNTLTYQAGEKIFTEGEPADTMFIVIKGQVEILKRTATGANRQLALLNSGDIMGEMALLDKLPRSATAIAKVPTELLSIREEGFLTLVSKNPEFGLKLMKGLSKKLRIANKHIAEYNFSLTKWVWSGMDSFAREKGERISAGFKIDRREFEIWAGLHLGITIRDLHSVFQQLVKTGQIWISSNKFDIVVKVR